MLGAEPEVLAEVEAGRISAYVARRITTQPGETQAALAAIASANRLSGTQTENLIRRLQVTGEEPELAARALGLTPAAPAPTNGGEPTSTLTQSDEPDPTGIERPEAAIESPENDAMTKAIERYQALLAATLPELADERIQAIAKLCARRSLRHSVPKVAGLIALVSGDTAPEQAVEMAGSITKAPGVREIVQIVDAYAHLRTIIRAGKMRPDVWPLVSGLGQIVNRLMTEDSPGVQKKGKR
jgi:hypothetical protein